MSLWEWEKIQALLYAKVGTILQDILLKASSRGFKTPLFPLIRRLATVPPGSAGRDHVHGVVPGVATVSRVKLTPR